MRKWHGNPWAILLTLSLGFFMTLLDLTIVNIAIPSMIDKLGASFDEILWVANSYILVLAVLLITAGRLGDIRGKKNMFIAGVVLFTIASLACGMAQDPAQLIGARVVQGLGAAMLMPQTMSIVIETFPAERRGAALGIWAAVAGVATIAGPTVGGLLVTALDWRWIFFVNVPIGLLVLVMSVSILPGAQREVKHRLDWTGVALATASLFCFVFGLTEGQRFEWNAAIWGLIAAGAALLVVFLLHQRTKQGSEPLVPFVLFRDRNFTIMNLVGIGVSLCMVGMMLPMTIYLQSVLGFNALKAGLVMAPASLVSMVVAPFAGRLSDRIGGKFILLAGLALFGIGTLWIAAIADVGSSWTAFIAPFTVLGLGIGGVFAPMATEAMRSVAPRLAGAASGVNNTLRQIGSVIGAAAVGAVLQHQLAGGLRDEAVQRAGSLPAGSRDQFVAGFAQAAKGGLEVGAGQTGAAQHLPAGTSPALAQRLHELAEQVFTHAFVGALKPTLAVPIAAAFVCAFACLGVKGRRATPPPAKPAATEAQVGG